MLASFFVTSFASSTNLPSTNYEQKVKSILQKMSYKAQKEIKISDYDEFVSDLQIVLNDETFYNKGDIPLYSLVDKTHYLSSDYVPKNLIHLTQNSSYNINRNDLSLTEDTEKNLRIMAEDAKIDGITLLVSSTYRSYEYQKNLFARYVKQEGLEQAMRFSAKEGTSQHQLGTAIDFGSITYSFINTKQGQWLYKNAYKYGFSLSFPEGYEDVTGYRYECWHYRFLGKNACLFQKKYFNDIQQYMLEFINLWKK